MMNREFGKFNSEFYNWCKGKVSEIKANLQFLGFQVGSGWVRFGYQFSV